MSMFRRSKKIFAGVLGTTMLMSCTNTAQERSMTLQSHKELVESVLTSAADISKFFPKTAKEAESMAAFAKELARKELDAILSIDKAQRTFDNTVRALDESQRKIYQVAFGLQMFQMVSPKKEIRDACQMGFIQLQQFSTDLYLNPDIYAMFNDYVQGNKKNEKLSEEEEYFFKESMDELKRSGLHLPPAELEKVKGKHKEIAVLKMNFEKNIAEDKSVVKATLQELEGLSDDFIKTLKKEDDLYILPCNGPVMQEVAKHCGVEKTREAMYLAFRNRAYPANEEILETVIQKRHELAQLLGYKTFAGLSVASKMAKNIETVESFLKDLAENSVKKWKQEFVYLKDNLPDGVKLDDNRNINEWDYGYVIESYKKKNLAIDDRKIAEYFPAQHALDSMLGIYEDFFGLKFKQVKPDWVWHEEVKLIEVWDAQNNELRGYIYLDLYPRDNKYTHACHGGIIPSQIRKNDDGTDLKSPSMAIVIANFPKANGGRPELLKFGDVRTFFHEFGHALHSVLGRTRLASHAGTSVKLDFVEMPSQMLEEWMYDKDILARVSSHYKTGKTLPEDIIEKLVELKKFDSGSFILRQALLSFYSLECFKGGKKDTSKLWKTLYEKYVPHHTYDDRAHMHASFGHLMNYSACYYVYMWSKVFALDLFYKIKEGGLVDTENGRRFADMVLSKGGSVDPAILLRNYLGREPNQEAFKKDLGFK